MSKSLLKTPVFEDVFYSFRAAAEALGPRAAVRLLLDNASLPAPALIEALEDAQAEEVAAAQVWSEAHQDPRPVVDRAADLAAEAVALLEIGAAPDEPAPDPRALSLLRAAAGILELTPRGSPAGGAP